MKKPNLSINLEVTKKEKIFKTKLKFLATG